MKSCAKKCLNKNSPCKESECPLWINFKIDLNCSLIAIHKNGEMTLQQCGERLGISHVRVKQIQDKALKKIKLKLAQD